jgi:nitrite reductase/ring-hydroxylating ferredoxin subunit
VDGPGPAPGELQAVDVAGQAIVLCNAAGRVYALEDRCPHADVKLSGGRLDGTVLECPLHGGKLDVRDGSPQRLPIRRPAITFPLTEVDGGFEIQLGA